MFFLFSRQAPVRRHGRENERLKRNPERTLFYRVSSAEKRGEGVVCKDTIGYNVECVHDDCRF